MPDNYLQPKPTTPATQEDLVNLSNSSDYISLQHKFGYYITFVLPNTDPQTTGNYTHFYTASRPCELLRATCVFSVAAGGATTLQLQKLEGTTAIGSGIDMLAVPFNLNGSAYVVQTRDFTDLVRTPNTVCQLMTDDRIGLDIASGTPTSSKDLLITLYFKPLGLGHFTL